MSLKQTIHRLLHSSHTPILSSSREILEFAYKHTTSLQEFLKEFYDSSSKRWNAFDVQIRDAVQKVEDAVELNVSNQFLSLPEGGLDFDVARQEINSFIETMTKMKDEYIKESRNPTPLDEDDDDDDDFEAVSSNTDFDKEMVGLSEEFAEIKAHILEPMRPYDFGVFSYVGKAGSCRTLATKILFNELFVAKEQPFDCGAWVSIGRNYQYTEILVTILAQINDDDEMPILENNAEKLGFYLYASLKGRIYMIVVDDIDNVEVWDFLKKFFPEQDNGSLIVLTTGIMEVAQFAKSYYIYERQRHLDDYLWDFLRVMIFGCELHIHPELEEAGKKIVGNCGGSRIAIARVILFLSNAEQTPECWSKLAAEEQNPIFVVEDEISEVSKIKEDAQKANKELMHKITALFNLSAGTNIVKVDLFPQRYFQKSEIMLFYGPAGVGKTTLIKKIFEDSEISHHFDHRVWVPLGPKYKSKEILVDILAQIYPDIDREHVNEDAKFVADLCEELSCKRCFIVLDDMWNPEPLYNLKILFPNIKAEIFITTRLLVLGPSSLGPTDDKAFKVRLLNKEESWDLLRQQGRSQEFYLRGANFTNVLVIKSDKYNINALIKFSNKTD